VDFTDRQQIQRVKQVRVVLLRMNERIVRERDIMDIQLSYISNEEHVETMETVKGRLPMVVFNGDVLESHFIDTFKGK